MTAEFSPVRSVLFAGLVLALVTAGAELARADSVVTFNEIHYHPWDAARAEWIELHNQMAVDVDLSGWALRGGIDFAFPDGIVIPAGGFLVVSDQPAASGVAGALGPWSGRLANEGERLRLQNNSGRLMDEVEYRDRGTWPIGSDGSGATLAKSGPESASDDPQNWRVSAQLGGTPGAENFPAAAPVGPATVLVPFDAAWRYNESGADLGAEWAGTAHPVDHADWFSGPGLLGFETTPASLPEPLRTTLRNPAHNSVVTYYFETEFELSGSELANLASLTLRHVIDDGGVFYLNGTEAGPRFNLDAGPISAATTASPAVRTAGYEGPFELPANALVEGPNRLSVEVHQQSSASADVVFGAELTMTPFVGPAAHPPLLISEMTGTADAGFRIEIANAGGSEVDAGEFMVASRGAVDESYPIPPGTLIEGNGFLVIDESALGFRPADGDRLFLFSPGRQALVHAARADDLPRAWSETHQRHLVPAASTFGAPNHFAINSDVVINEIMYHFREDPGTPGRDAEIETLPLVPIGATWRYNESGTALPAGWQTTGHPVDGSEWFEGPALFGYDFDPLPEPIRTEFADPSSAAVVAYYLETEFTLTPAQLASPLTLQLRHIIDDGAVFYLNGVEVDRFNMPVGEVTATTHADPPVRDATWEGRFELPASALMAGPNRLSVQLHQQTFPSTDIVFGAELTAVRELAPAEPPRPVVERDEEWVELHNKGAAALDLGGWSLDGGINFVIPAGTTVPAGGFLVVANDAAALRAKYPALGDTLIGDFRNRLGDRRDVIRLEDAFENPVDKVRYWEGGRWPELADGRGSSLELRDPHADNACPEAWAASDEGAKQDWQTIVCRGTGSQSYGLSDWNEFRVGMLQAGEVLIDDLRVVRDPDGAREDLIQNGSFSAGDGTWRFLGNHRHSRVIDEPGNPDNNVLHLVATGPHDTRHNHIESTFVENTEISAAETYEVSFRARWVAGSNQLNTRCYYQRLARTTRLERPESCGTPGTANSRLDPNLGPTFSNLRHAPPVPAPDEPIRVTAEAADPDGLGSFVLKARYDEGALRSFSCTIDSAGRILGSLPGAEAGTVIQFWLEGRDARGASSAAPAAGADSRALIQVDDGQGTQRPLQELRLVMLDSDRDFMLETLNLMSNDRLGGTVIYNGRHVTYDVGIRLRGSAAGRARDGTNFQGFNVAFPDDQLFRGVHSSIRLDRSHRHPVALRPDEIYVKHMFNHAGVPCMYDDLVHLIGPGPTYTGIALLTMAGFGSHFTETQFENGGRGSVYSPAATYDPSTSIGGVEGPKPPVPFSDIRSDFRDLGDSEEDYRNLCELRTGRRRDDFAALIEFCRTMSLPDAQLEARIESVMDVDGWMRYAALTMLCGIGDTYVGGCLPCNIRLYAPPPGEGTVMALPWDNDFVFLRSTTHSMLPEPSNLRRVIDIPRFRRLYWGHVHDLVRRTFNPGYMRPWLAHYGEVIGADLSGQASYIAARGSFALNQLPPQIPFTITTNDGNDFTVDGTRTTLEGRGWVDVREFRLAGRSEPLTAEWIDNESWRLAVPLLPGANSIELEAYDFSGNLIATESLVITSTATEPQPVDFLRLTELHFHPDGGEGTEFVELKNVGPQPLALGGVAFVDGINFTIPLGVVLDPGAHALVVHDRAAFEARYGSGLPVLGEYAPDNLSNGGERLALHDASGNVIHDFTWSDRWLPAADGGGYSLVVRDESAAVESWTGPAGWALSGEPGGNPNADNPYFAVQFEGWQHEHFSEVDLATPTVSGPLADANGDGVVNLLKYAAGVSPWTPPSLAALTSPEVRDGRVRLLVRRVRNSVDLEIDAEFGSTLTDWSRAPPPGGTAIDHGDGTETIIFEDDMQSELSRFGRVRVTLAPP